MAFEVVVPQMGESVLEGTIVEWKVKEGEIVKVNQPLVEIMTDKVMGKSGAMICFEGTSWQSVELRGTNPWKRVRIAVVNTTGKTRKIAFCVRLGDHGATVTGKARFRNIVAYPVEVKSWRHFNDEFLSHIFYIE